MRNDNDSLTIEEGSTLLYLHTSIFEKFQNIGLVHFMQIFW